MRSKNILNERAHRPWALPEGAWLMRQTWFHLLFAHWAVDPAVVSAHIPGPLALDTYEGEAYVGVVPFEMKRICPRMVSRVPGDVAGVTAFCELNVRTYVTYGGKAGVYFFSLDAASSLAVAAARRFFHLPYYRAEMSCRREASVGRVRISYSSRRRDRRSASVGFEGRYGPRSDAVRADAGSIAHFLTERYCLFTTDGRGRVFRGDIHHVPWPLQEAEAEIEVNEMTSLLDIPLRGAPLLHYAESIDAIIWGLREVGGEG